MNKRELLRLSNILWDKSRDIYSELYENEDSFKDIMDYRQLHSKIVADLAIDMFDKYYVELFGVPPISYKASLYFACLIHDVRKLDKRHNFSGAKFFLQQRELLESSLYDFELTFNIINYHSADKKGSNLEYINEIRNLNDNVKLLLLFTRLSDKLSKLIVKSCYREISLEEVDVVINKIENNSQELFAFNEKIAKIIKEIQINFQVQYC